MSMSRRLPTGFALFAIAVLALPARAAEAEKYLPDNTDGVVTINVRTLMDSALVGKVLEQIKPALKADSGAQKILDAIGIDPFKDVELVQIGAPGGGDPDKAVFVIQGKFQPAKIHAVAAKAAEEHADVLKIEKVGDTNLYQVTPPGRNQKVSYAALLGENLLVASVTRDLVVEAIDKKAGKKKPELKKALADLLAKSDSKQAISVVALDTVGQGELAGQVKSLTGGFTITDEVKMDFRLTAKDEKAATAVADKIEEGLGQVSQLVMFLGQKDPRFAPLVDVMKTVAAKPDGATVRVTGEINKSVLEKVEKMLKDAKAKQ
jgi:hypothetical protein